MLVPILSLVAGPVAVLPLQLKSDAVGTQVMGKGFFLVPFEKGRAEIRLGGKKFAVRRQLEKGVAVFDVDRNGDGRFDLSERVELISSPVKDGKGATFTSQVAMTTLRPPGVEELKIGFRLVPSTPPTFPPYANKLIVGPSFAFVGRASFGGKSMAVGVTSIGSGEARLTIDRDGNGISGDQAAECFEVGQPFNIGSTTYQAQFDSSLLKPKLVLNRSKVSVKEVLVQPVGTVVARAAPAPAVAQPPAEPLLAANTVAPDFVANTIDGKPVALSSLRGKVVILDFWATWCGPCMVSMPGLQKIYREVEKQGVVVLSVNTWDEKADFEKWVKTTKYDFNFVRDPAEGDHDAIRKASIARKLYHAPGIPTLYVIDREGKIVQGLVGSGNEANVVKALGKVGVTASVPELR